ncbi:MAG: hypothetical protein HQ500_03175, partial [Flavobacteriales bacterium]|nr:hypothetical protein [Flavobacteriales bacterium]
DIATNIANIQENADSIAAAQADIAANATNIQTNSDSIAAAQADIATNALDILGLDAQIQINQDSIFILDSLIAAHVLEDEDTDSLNERINSVTFDSLTNALTIVENDSTFMVDLSSIGEDSTRIGLFDSKVYIDPSDSTVVIEISGQERYRFYDGRVNVIAASSNLGMGGNALSSNGTGFSNTAFGSGALATVDSGFANTAVGAQALTISTGKENTAVGADASASTTTGERNISVGNQALSANTTGSGNVAVGWRASGEATTTGDLNTAIGFRTLANNNGNNNTAIGAWAGDHNAGSSNVFIGFEAGYSDTNANSQLYIENSSSLNPLIWGDFLNDTVRIGGSFQVLNTGGDLLTYPLADGANGEVITTDGSGNLSFAATIGDDLGDHTLDTNLITGTRFISGDGDDEGLYIDNSGNVGIGSNTPGAQLEVSSSSFVHTTLSGSNTIGTWLNLSNTSAGGRYYKLISTGSANGEGTGKLMFAFGNAAGLASGVAMIIDSNHVGIGTSSPSEILHVGGNTQIDDTLKLPNGASNGYVLTSDANGNATWEANDAGDSTQVADGDNDTKIQVEELVDEDQIRFDIAGTENYIMDGRRLHVTNTGNSVYIGLNAGDADNSGSKQNVAIGDRALESSSTGNSIVAIGRHSQRNATGGYGNVSIGESSLYSNGTGTGNTNIGNRAGILNTNSNNNTLLGADVDFYNTSGSNNTLLGYEAGRGTANHTKSGNIFLGYQAGYNDTTNNKLYIQNSNSASPLIWGDFTNDILQVGGTFRTNNLAGDTLTYPTADGTSGQVITTDGSGNLSFQAISPQDSTRITDADGDTRIEADSGLVDDDAIHFYMGGTQQINFDSGRVEVYGTNGNLYYGSNTGRNDDYSSTFANTAFGDNAYIYNSGSTFNTTFGAYSMGSGTTGSRNAAFGYLSLDQNEDNENTAIGYRAMPSHVTGQKNTALGASAGYLHNTGSFNVFIGERSAQNMVNGQSNVIMGSGAGILVEEGDNNTFLGFNAGRLSTGATTSGSIKLGYSAGNNDSADNRLFIENSSSASPLIYGEFDNDIAQINGTFRTSDGVDTLSYPTSDGSNGQVLTTDGSGNL